MRHHRATPDKCLETSRAALRPQLAGPWNLSFFPPHLSPHRGVTVGLPLRTGGFLRHVTATTLQEGTSASSSSCLKHSEPGVGVLILAFSSSVGHFCALTGLPASMIVEHTHLYCWKSQPHATQRQVPETCPYEFIITPTNRSPPSTLDRGNSGIQWGATWLRALPPSLGRAIQLIKTQEYMWAKGQRGPRLTSPLWFSPFKATCWAACSSNLNLF